MRGIIQFLAAMIGVTGVAETGTGPTDPVVYIENASGYQGVLQQGSLGGTSLGSGFLVDPRREVGMCSWREDGALFLLTNEHVVRSANELQVTFLRRQGGGAIDQLAVPAQIVAVDARVDLALLRVSFESLAARGLDPRSVSAMSLWRGKMEDLPQGLVVEAMGNPRGLKRTVTRGVVSAALQEIGGSFRFLQTDAAINPGNSGGPLIRPDTGEVVGVNARGLLQSQNLGFAIPAARARTFLEQVLCGSGPTHATLFVSVEPVDERTRSILGLAEQRGVVVVNRVPVLATSDYPLEELDVILAVEFPEDPVAGALPVGPGGTPFLEALFDRTPREQVRLTVWRHGRALTVDTLLERLENTVMDRGRYLEFLGGMFEDIPDSMRAQEAYGGMGVVLGVVVPGTPLDEASMSALDVVRRILVRQGERLVSHEIRSLEDLRRITSALHDAIEGARRGRGSLLVGFHVYNLESHEQAYRYLRVRDGSAAR